MRMPRLWKAGRGRGPEANLLVRDGGLADRNLEARPSTHPSVLSKAVGLPGARGETGTLPPKTLTGSLRPGALTFGIREAPESGGGRQL